MILNGIYIYCKIVFFVLWFLNIRYMIVILIKKFNVFILIDVVISCFIFVGNEKNVVKICCFFFFKKFVYFKY